MRKLVKTIAFVLCAVLLLSIPCAAAYKYVEPQTVRVGFFAFPGYHNTDENGRLSGYGYDYLMHLSRYCNLEYVFVGYDKSWSEMQEMLVRGEIDLLTSAHKTDEREASFAFSEEPIGASSTVLTVKAGNTAFRSGRYDSWSGIRVGLLPDSSRNDSLAAFAAENGFSYTPVYYPDAETLAQALQEGAEIDAIVTSSLRSHLNEWTIAEFDPADFYIITRSSDTQLMSTIDDAINQLSINEPGLIRDLERKYYSPATGSEIAFTAEELAFIEDMKHSSFRAIINPDRAPLSCLENGEFTGILADLLKEIIARTGLDIQWETLSSRAQYLRCIRENNYDIRLDCLYDFSNASDSYCLLTEPYAESTISRLRLKSNVGPYETVAVIKGSELERMLPELNLDGCEPVYCENMDEVIKAVGSGKADITYLYTRSGEYYDSEDERERFITELVSGKNCEFAIGVSRNCNYLLTSILNKAVLSLSQEDVESISAPYVSSLSHSVSLVRFIYSNPVLLILAILLVVALAFFILRFHYVSHQQKIERLRMEEEAQKNALLRDALNDAEQANTVKSMFLSRISHEMRTPLNAIIGFMTLAREKGIEPKKVLDYLTKSELAAHQLLSIINDVLDMSAIESGKMRVASEPFDLAEVLTNVTSIYSTECNQKGLSFETKMISEIDETVIGDPVRLKQILMNILSNAVKFTSSGGVTLSIRKQNADDTHVYISFSVSDTGCGMSDDMKQRLFHPFEQESTKTAILYGGNGLGLSIVKNLVSLLGGTISVESEQNVGSTFTVVLPFLLCEPLPKFDSDKLQRLRVLGVDDDPDAREYAELIFKRVGVRYKCVGSGQEMVDEVSAAEAQGDPYDVCFVDWKMPGMDGVEATRAVREKFYDDTLVVIATAYDYSTISDVAKDAGANMVISKPLFQSTVVNVLMKQAGCAVAAKSTKIPHEYLRGKRALIVEDNDLNMQVAVGLLENIGMFCEKAENGLEAVHKFQSSPSGHFDIILMDVQMPEMNGYEATRRIRSSNHRDAKSIAIVAMTANAFPEDVSKALSCGMNDHFAKPIDVDVMYETIDRAIHLSVIRKD